MVSSTPKEQIVYCVSSVQKIIDQQLDFVFTDGHAKDSFSTQYAATDIQNIDAFLDKKAINARDWIDDNDLDLKRRKQAEFLVFGDIAIDAVLGFGVLNESAKNSIIAFGADVAKVHIRPNFYF